MHLQNLIFLFGGLSFVLLPLVLLIFDKQNKPDSVTTASAIMGLLYIALALAGF